MDFLSSPIHNYSYETFDDAFFELPKEMDFEVSDELRDGVSYTVDDDDDLNDGMYGVWNAKHPWSVNNNAASIYNSNLHLDFIGGDPESAMMVNPNIVIPSGFQFDDENVKIEKAEEEKCVSTLLSSTKMDARSPSIEEDHPTIQVKKIKSKFLSLRENIVSGEDCGRTSLKNGIRVLKPSVVDSPPVFTGSQLRSENGNSRLKSKNNSHLFYHDRPLYPKPAFSYSCLIAMALKNSKHGCLPVAEIYNFMCNHFPYFKTAPNGWKNSVRHNLSLNKCFEKIEKPAGSTQRKGCLWALNPNKAAKLEEEVQKCTKKDMAAIKRAMEYPEHLELLEKGELKSLYDTEHGLEDDEDDEDMEDPEDDSLVCDDDVTDERLSEGEYQEPKAVESEVEQYPVLNVANASELPEFNIEVDGSIYEELVGSIKNEQLFTINESAVSGPKSSPAMVKKYFIQVNGDSGKNAMYQSKTNDPEVFDHYDIDSVLRLDHETKLAASRKTPQRFNRRVCPSPKSKQIKFKTWN